MRSAMDCSDPEWWELVVVRPTFPVTDNLASADGRVIFVQGLISTVDIDSPNAARVHCFSRQ
jgi:hypothetical protein